MYAFKLITTITLIAVTLLGMIATAVYLFWRGYSDQEFFHGAIAYTATMATACGIFAAAHYHGRTARE